MRASLTGPAIPMRCLLLIMLLVSALPAAAADVLRVSWGTHNAPPYAIVTGNALTGGIIHDIGRLLGRKLGRPVAFVEVPRARNEEQLRSRNIDVVCITNPAWMKNPGEFVWSPKLFSEAGAVIQAAGTTPWNGIADLAGKRIGTILGYRYPNVDELFADGRASRDDAADLDSNMQRLAIGRVDAVIDSDLPVRWWLAQHDTGGHYPVARFVTSRHDVQCAVSRQTPGADREIPDAFRSMLEDGSLQGVLARYRIAE